jgi:LPXTG-site transpeptidase (sortase) family protein
MSPHVTAFIGAAITLIGGFFLSYNYVQAKKIIAYDYMSNLFYNGNEVITITEEEKTNKPIVEEKLPEEVTNEYIGYLIIPKINLTKGFLDVRSTENDVEKNILVVDGSNYPDTDRGNLILAGHSGTGWKAFFNELYQLQVGDTAYVTYKEKKYVYRIANIYKQPKTGKLAIYRDYDKTTLTLITCAHDSDTEQTVYIAELV